MPRPIKYKTPEERKLARSGWNKKAYVKRYVGEICICFLLWLEWGCVRTGTGASKRSSRCEKADQAAIKQKKSKRRAGTIFAIAEATPARLSRMSRSRNDKNAMKIAGQQPPVW